MQWLALLLALPGLVGSFPASASSSVPSALSCDQAYPSAPLVCSGRIPSWDGVPLDTDLTLPAGPLVPRPLIVMLHGYANQKTEWESASAANDNPDKDHYNNFWLASQGYAVLTYTAPGSHSPVGQGL